MRWLRPLTIWLLTSSFLIAQPEMVRVRDKEACGVYLAQAHYEGGKRLVDDTNGVQVASLNLKDFDRYARNVPDRPDGVFIVSGLPLYGKQKREFTAGFSQILKEQGLGDIPVRYVNQPRGTGLTRAFQELRYFFMMGSDVQAPVKTEAANGIASVLASEMIVAVFAFSSFPVLVAIPLVVVGGSTNLTLAVFRRTMSNWLNRSTGRPWEKPIKEMMVSSVFSGIYYGASQFPKYVETASAGVLPSAQGISGEVWNFFSTQYPTWVTHGFFFSSTFSGFYLWDQLKSRTKEGNDEVRRTAPVLIGGVFTLTTPILIWAATSNQAIIDLQPYLQLNGGQLSLMGLAGAGALLWMRPTLLNPTVKWVDKLYYGYLNKVLSPVSGFLKRTVGKLMGVRDSAVSSSPPSP